MVKLLWHEREGLFEWNEKKIEKQGKWARVHIFDFNGVKWINKEEERKWEEIEMYWISTMV